MDYKEIDELIEKGEDVFLEEDIDAEIAEQDDDKTDIDIGIIQGSVGDNIPPGYSDDGNYSGY